MLPPSPTHRQTSQGWFDPNQGLLILETAAGVRVLDSLGTVQAEFDPALTEPIRQRLRGVQANSALLGFMLQRSPALARALSPDAVALTATGLLGADRWGQLFVELTAKCNERCVHCYASSSPERTEALDRRTALSVVREAAGLEFEVIQFTGGEPLLAPYLVEAVSLARELGTPLVEVYTNGVLLNEPRYAELRDAGAAFAFSLYGRDPARHDAVTRLPGSHRKTVAAIGRAVAGGSSVRVGVIATCPEDEEQATAAAALARELGVPADRVRLQVVHDVGRGRYSNWESSLAGTGTEGDHRSSVPDSAQPLRYGKAAVLPDGSVTPCIFSRELRLGRVGPEGGLRAALEGPAVELSNLDVKGVGARLARSCSQLSCGECRLTAALLCPSSAPRSAPLPVVAE